MGPNLFHQSLTVSWQMSIPRSCKRFSTFRSESGNFTYIITTKRITSGDESNQRNGLAALIFGPSNRLSGGALPAGTFELTEPADDLR